MLYVAQSNVMIDTEIAKKSGFRTEIKLTGRQIGDPLLFQGEDVKLSISVFSGFRSMADIHIFLCQHRYHDQSKKGQRNRDQGRAVELDRGVRRELAITDPHVG